MIIKQEESINYAADKWNIQADYINGGVNHFTWITDFMYKGKTQPVYMGAF